jgi:hypothetical protein
VFATVVGSAYAYKKGFPGAKEYGTVSVSGREGKIIKMTNLKTSRRGNLQDAVNQQGPKIIVFKISGIINGDVKIRRSNVTIAGGQRHLLGKP